MRLVKTGLALAALLLAAPAQAQNFPVQPVHLVVGAAPGGGFDQMARLLADEMTKSLGQPVVVDNKPGAGAVVSTAFVGSSKPDGYTVGMIGGNHSTNHHLTDNLPYNTEKDFAPVILLAKTPFVVVVHKDVPAKTLAEFIALSKAKPGAVMFTATQPNGQSHLAIEMLKKISGADLTFVPYKGSAPALTDLLAGTIPMMVDAPVTSMQHIAAGKIRALAVTSAQRAALMPDVPTIAESGFPGVDVSAWVGIVAPAGTPDAVLEKLNAAFAGALKVDSVKKRLDEQAWVAAAGSRAEMAAFLKSEDQRWGEIIRSANLKR
jgi:tripartite-type tricarboxylate transporter receptor subunit TctC